MPNTAPDNPPVRVAVGVIRDAAGRVLIALRPPHKHMGDLWEFPGGKIEVGESCQSALERELFEELGIRVRQSKPLLCVPFNYLDKKVLLEVREVVAFDGEPQGKEGQPLRWVPLAEMRQYDFPAANAPIVKAVQLPNFVCITGEFADKTDMSFRIKRAIERGAGMVVFRPGACDCETFENISASSEVCASEGVPFLVSSAVPPELWSAADGVHLRSDHLHTTNSRPVGSNKWFGASCHTLADAERAESLGADYIFLSPVLLTDSHPAAATLGWENFAGLAAELGLPVFALGGLKPDHYAQAREAGARGVAGISAFWK